ncbi:MAG: transposase [Chitinophagaceae bacterium]
MQTVTASSPVTVQHILQQYHTTSPHPHVGHVIAQLKKCKTSELGYHLYKCSDDECSGLKYQFHGCRTRHCGQCGSFRKDEWVDDRKRELLPIGYFHVVFTLPHELNPIIMGNRKILFKLLFQASAATLLSFGDNELHLGARPGIISVLHTWGQDMSFHPHIHCIVSGGGIVANDDGTVTWKNARRIKDDFLFPVNAMRTVFRAKFLEGLKALHLQSQLTIPEGYGLQRLVNILYKKKWNIYAKAPCAGPEQVIEYLGRYTNTCPVLVSGKWPSVITESSATILKPGWFHSRYKDYADDNAEKVMTLKGSAFVRRFEQHILPKGFTKIRSYGYLSNRGKEARMAQITTAIKVPAHPKKIKVPWMVRLVEKFGVAHTQCPHCKKDSLQLISVQYQPTYKLKKLDDS